MSSGDVLPGFHWRLLGFSLRRAAEQGARDISSYLLNPASEDSLLIMAFPAYDQDLFWLVASALDGPDVVALLQSCSKVNWQAGCVWKGTPGRDNTRFNVFYDSEYYTRSKHKLLRSTHLWSVNLRLGLSS